MLADDKPARQIIAKPRLPDRSVVFLRYFQGIGQTTDNQFE